MAEKKTTAKKAPKTAAPKSGEVAVILAGGKQYIVAVGDIVDIERLGGEHKDGDEIIFDQVLLVDNGTDTTIGTPFISGAQVKAEYQGEKKAKKITIIRYKAKSNRDRKLGHRQKYSRVKIVSFS